MLDAVEKFTFENLPLVLRQALKEQIAYAPSGETVALHANVSLSQALTLYSTVRRLRPLVSVEAGFANGISTLAILQAIADNKCGVHHVIDPFQNSEFGGVGLEMVRRAGLDSHCVFHETFVEHVVPDLPPLQFGFIDASHVFDLTLVEFVLMDKKLDVGGVIGLHDLWMPAQKKAMRYILNNRPYQVVRERARNKKSVRQKLGKRISRTLDRLPFSEQILSSELRNYHLDSDFENLMILQKMANDERNWQFHRTF